MAGATVLLQGHARRTLVSTTGMTIVGSTLLGTFNVQQYSRFTGLLSVVGSATLRYQLGVSSGTYQVSSSFVANSGGSAFDVLNLGGNVAEFSFSAANSQSNVAANILGEPLR